jgi:hypothetical protein
VLWGTSLAVMERGGLCSLIQRFAACNYRAVCSGNSLGIGRL